MSHRAQPPTDPGAAEAGVPRPRSRAVVGERVAKALRIPRAREPAPTLDPALRVDPTEPRTAAPADQDDITFDVSAAERARRDLFAAHLADDPSRRREPRRPTGPPPDVTAVLVAHNGARWLPTTLAALRAQRRAPDRVVAVDTSSADDSAALLRGAFGAPAVLRLPASTPYGGAVAAALGAASPAPTDGSRPRWIWLLHDDSAPAPDALQHLLAYADLDPTAAVLGSKAVDWDRLDRLVDIGQSTDAAGRRETFLEPGELDQGQHERPRDVLAVGTAGALIRRETWDALDGFDPALPLLREDLDFGWRAVRSGRRVVVVPAARIRHARATLTHRRDGALVANVGRTDRAHALYVSVLDGGGLGGLLRLPRLVLGVLVRALVLLAGRRVVDAYDEVAAGLDVVGRPQRLLAGRRWRREQLSVPPRAVRPLLSRGTTRLRAMLLATTDRLAGPGDAGPAAIDEHDGLPSGDAHVVRRLLLRPGLLLTAALTVLALLADRHLLHGGALIGGRLLPVDPGASDLWRTYVGGWHDTGGGSGSPASPWLPVLALVSIPFGGNPAAAVTVLVLGAVPLAGLSAWWATRRLGLWVGLRLWAAATYALLPPLVGAQNGGRFDALVAVIAVPMLLAAGMDLLRTDGPLHRAFALGLGIAIVAAFSPPVWLLAAGLLGASVLVSFGGDWMRTRSPRPHWGRLRLAAAALAVAPVVLVPWSLSVLHHPRVLLVGLGGPGSVAPAAGRPVGAGELLLVHPGGHAAVPSWVVVPLVLAALAGCLRAARRRGALAAWTVVAVGLVGGLAAARVGATATGHAPDGWSGVGLAAAAAGFVLGAVLAGHGARRALRDSHFGLRQPLAVVLAAATAAVPLAAAGWLVVRGAGSPLHRAGPDAIPAAVVDAAAGDPGQRILMLRPQAGRVAYALSPVAGPRLGDEDLRASPATRGLVAHLVADLASARGTDAAEALSTFHVRYVALEGPADSGLAGVLDGQPALSRFALPGGADLWQVLEPSSRLELLTGATAAAAESPAAPDAPTGRGPTAAELAADPAVTLPAAAEGAVAPVPAGVGGRLVVLSDSASGRWRATLDGARLTPVTAWGWAQAFRLPASGGTLRMSYDAGARTAELWWQLVAVVIALVLAGPGGRRGEEELAEPADGVPVPDRVWAMDDPEPTVSMPDAPAAGPPGPDAPAAGPPGPDAPAAGPAGPVSSPTIETPPEQETEDAAAAAPEQVVGPTAPGRPARVRHRKPVERRRRWP